jgi:hypothetical protein
LRSKSAIVVVLLAALALMILPTPDAAARGGGRGGGGGASRGGGGSFSRSSGSSVSRPSYSAPVRTVSPSRSLPSAPSSISYQSAGRLPAAAAVNRPSTFNGAAQLPSGVRPAPTRVQLPSNVRPSTPNRPAQQPVGGRQDAGNFLGVSGGAGTAGGSLGSQPSQLPVNRAGNSSFGQQIGNRQPVRPQERANWNERSQNRNANWQQRVDNRNESWNQRQENRQQNRTDFQQNREKRWNEVGERTPNAGEGQHRGDWQEHRENLWDYRYDRADEVWDDVRDYHDDLFDDHWWGHSDWDDHHHHVDYYPADPWWWWTPASWDQVTVYVYEQVPTEPVYVDYGLTNAAVVAVAASAEQPPPPVPPSAEGQSSEWLPLGVYALVQEEKGDPNMFMQLSVNRQGQISGAYENTLTGNKKPIAGMVDKKTQVVSWRIGENRETVCATTLGNLTQDVSPVALYFSPERVENWLLVRLPEPAKAGEPPKPPEIKRVPPPVSPTPAAPPV